MNQFLSYLAQSAKDLDNEVQAILDEWLKEVGRISPKLVPLAQAFVKACEGGKRLRGTLVRLGYELGKESTDYRLPTSAEDRSQKTADILKVGAAYEIFHAAILAHDDIIDQSSLRRGKPTLYKVLGGDHYGISQTLSLGDIGFFLAVEIIAQSNFPAREKNSALKFFAETVINTGFGQALDVEVPHLGGVRKEEDVIAIHKLKTAQYTISGPLIVGAILAGSDKELLGKLGRFGESLGIAFQIQDDILGVFGDEETLGKSVTSDIEEGKNTLLITEALKRANQQQRKILDQYYGKGPPAGGLRSQGLEAVRQVFMQTGSLDYSRQKGVEYVVRAKSIIPRITKDQQIVRLLTEMADFLVERSF